MCPLESNKCVLKVGRSFLFACMAILVFEFNYRSFLYTCYSKALPLLINKDYLYLPKDFLVYKTWFTNCCTGLPLCTFNTHI